MILFFGSLFYFYFYSAAMETLAVVAIEFVAMKIKKLLTNTEKGGFLKCQKDVVVDAAQIFSEVVTI